MIAEINWDRFFARIKIIKNKAAGKFDLVARTDNSIVVGILEGLDVTPEIVAYMARFYNEKAEAEDEITYNFITADDAKMRGCKLPVGNFASFIEIFTQCTPEIRNMCSLRWMRNSPNTDGGVQHVRMNMEILNIIHAVLDYKRYVISHNHVVKNDDFNWYDQVTSFFNSLPLPAGMLHNRETLEKILHYDEVLLEKYDQCEDEELGDYIF